MSFPSERVHNIKLLEIPKQFFISLHALVSPTIAPNDIELYFRKKTQTGEKNTANRRDKHESQVVY